MQALAQSALFFPETTSRGATDKGLLLRQEEMKLHGIIYSAI